MIPLVTVLAPFNVKGDHEVSHHMTSCGTEWLAKQQTMLLLLIWRILDMQSNACEHGFGRSYVYANAVDQQALLIMVDKTPKCG